jgi:hypothetical protein
MALAIWIALVVAYFWSVRSLARTGWPKDTPASPVAERPRVEASETRLKRPATVRPVYRQRPAPGEALARRSL